MNLSHKVPPLVVALVFAALIYLPVYLPADFLPRLVFDGQNIMALFVAIVGLGVVLLAIISLIKLKTTINPLTPESASALVTTGLFKFSRNPMYLGMLLLIVSLWINTGAVMGFIWVPAFVVYLNYFQIAPEERAMKQLFPGRYEAYCQQVRRWF